MVEPFADEFSSRNKHSRSLPRQFTQLLYHYFSLFLAKKFMILINHPGSNDPTPDEADRKLIRALQADEQILSFKPFFADFIIVAKRSYFSMATNDGTACHCGHQEYIPEN